MDAGPGAVAALTRPAEPCWPGVVPGYRRAETSAVVGVGDEAWRRAAHGILRWGVKTESGFDVDAAGPVRAGERLVVRARVLGATIEEPVEVVEVADAAHRVGFAYRALPGHPVRGEEAFVVHRDGERVVLTIRSLTRPAESGVWRTLYPALLVAQQVARWRYRRSLG